MTELYLYVWLEGLEHICTHAKIDKQPRFDDNREDQDKSKEQKAEHFGDNLLPLARQFHLACVKTLKLPAHSTTIQIIKQLGLKKYEVSSTTIGFL